MQELSLSSLKKWFEKSADIQFQTISFSGMGITLVTCEAMIDGQQLNEIIIPRLQQLGMNQTDEDLESRIQTQLYLPGLQQPTSEDEIVTLVYSGHALIYFERTQFLYTSDISKKPNRQPEETRLEVPVKGPRDNFIEDLATNIALVRKRLPTNSLCVEKFELGRRSKTEVAVLYFDDIVSDNTLQQIRSHLSQVDVDIVFSGELIMEDINSKGYLFPRSNYTARADYAIQSLARGRFLILVDGVSYGVITPINLFMLLKTAEDNEYPVIYASIQRSLRIVSIFVGLMLPSFWLALTTYHQNQLPLQLLATVVQANLGLPFPSVFEMLLMLGMFELFREAGLRLPSSVGSTIGVVGGIIIGDAAIRAGLTSPAMIVIIATSTIATYTLANQSLLTAISILRVCFILLTAFMGLFGFYLSLFFTLLYLCSIRIFGVPYMNIATDLSWHTIIKSLFRLSPSEYKKRPDVLAVKDKTRTKEAKK